MPHPEHVVIPYAAQPLNIAWGLLSVLATVIMAGFVIRVVCV